MKLLLLGALALGAVLASPDGKETLLQGGPSDAGQSSQLDCSSLGNGTAPCTCTYDPHALSLTFGSVTNAESLVAIMASLFTATQQHYWSHLEVHCVSSTEPQISAQLFTGPLKFESVTFVGNCTRVPNWYTKVDQEVLRLSMSANEIPFTRYVSFLGPIKLERLVELTLRKIAFQENVIDGYFSHNSGPTEPLRRLTIRSCNVSTVQSGAFYSFSNLELVDLSYNQISRLPRSALAPTLTSLRALKLEHNQLASLEPGFFDGLPQLREINLSFNHMMTLPSLTPNSKLIQVLRLGENPWLCRCPMTWILGAPGFAQILYDKPACASPDFVRDKPLIEGLAVVDSTFC